MHISDGILDLKTCLVGYAGAAAFCTFAIRKTNIDQVAKISVMGAVFFISSIIHFKLGIISTHFSFLGLLGIILGFPSVLAILTGLFFQAIVFQHGGLTTLGVNTLVHYLPALAAYYAYKISTGNIKNRILLKSLLAGIYAGIAILLSSFLIFAVIFFTDKTYRGMAIIFSLSNGILAVLEGFITFLVVRQILAVKPDMLSL